MNQRTRSRGLATLTAGVVGLPFLVLVALSGPSGTAAPASPRPAPDLVRSSQPEVVTVARTPAPRRTAPAARRAAARGATALAYPIPTSDAGLGRITRAPDGAMWFIESDKNKVGRITTTGALTEFTLPPTTTGDGVVKDLDIDAAGNAWVVWDTGWKVTRFHPSNPAGGYSWEFTYPYGEEVRVGPDATWVTLSYDEDGIAKIVGNTMTWTANAPECDGALGRGRDGLMWCQQFNRLIRVNTDGNGGATFPLPADATYPYSVATGPNHKIWFGRDDGGSMFTSPSDGNVGWITSTNTVKTLRTGSRTAPRSLVTGDDGNVWFTSVGAAKGIGHVNASGVGAVAAVGNYRPTSVTHGKDGAIWFTDNDNNSVVRVERRHLWVTNVNVGSGSQLKPHTQPKVKVRSKKLNADRPRKKAKLTLSCGKGLVPCVGKVVVRSGNKLVGKGAYSVGSKSSQKVTVKLNAAARAQLKRRGSVPVTITLKPTAGKKVNKPAVLTR